MKPARLRPAAKLDLDEQALWYAKSAGAALGHDFVDTALAALMLLETQPGIGSLRWNAPDHQPVLRAWRVRRFPALRFYVERQDHIDVLRLLGEREDTTAILAAGLD